ncbi:M-phase phosphoprotein 8-like [Uloborus diversus]|uniref:M-phase phosphoprotein 8-like n=1 Tax=Uloborus diversus TaxID=327109 RepID=UPI00240930CB|nr:M-phase phosphoprotein 8-like [Uloborus diversus]
MVETEPKHFLIQGDVYEVEKLVGVKIVKGKKLYRVRWRGYGRESDTLEPEENLLSCKDMILELEEKMKDRHDKKRNKKSFRCQSFIPDSKDLIMYESSRFSTGTTWQATEVKPAQNLKDTFWRDFNEGKISVSDQDMYSKVKERASRTFTHGENGKSTEVGQKDNLPPLCPKVVLKRKPCNRTNSESLTYKSTLKVKPISMHIKKRKKYDVLRDYRRRKNRVHRKRTLDENRRRIADFKSAGIESYSIEASQSNSNILQELLIKDDQRGFMQPEYVTNFSGPKMDSDMVSSSSRSKEVHKRLSKDSCDEKPERKNQPLMCKISIHDKAKGIYSAHKHGSNSERKESYKSHTDTSSRKMFSSLLDAAVNDELDKIDRLCSNQYVVNFSQEDGTTALMFAAKMGLYNVAKILLKANAHKDKQNNQGETALMLACKNRQPRIAKLLLEHGANFAITNIDGVNVLRITNQYASETILHSILVEHIMRIVSEFESRARYVVEHIADIKYALFPIQCFSLNEGPKYSINFHHHVKLESPGKIGKQNLLFIASSAIKGSSIRCDFNADSLVRNVFINGIKQEVFNKVQSVYKMSGLQNGNNKVAITTAHYPESEVKLIVCAYRVHKSMVWFPTQKLKSEFLD